MNGGRDGAPVSIAETATATDTLDPWRHAARVSRQLGWWSLASVLVGAALLLTPERTFGALAPVAFGFGLQCLLWGAIDGVIASIGAFDLRRRHAAGEPHDAAATRAFGRRLRRLLRLNAGLDVLYVAVGLALLALWRTPEGLGHGLGVVVQGGFLLVFDAWHGWRVPHHLAEAP